MTAREDRNRDQIREALAADTTHSKARAVIEALLDLHHEYKSSCYHCSRNAAGAWPRISWPCDDIKTIRRVVGLDG